MDLVPQLPEALLENHDVDGVVLGNEDLQLGLSVRCLGGGGGGLRRLGGSTLVCSVNHRLRDLNLWCLHTSHRRGPIRETPVFRLLLFFEPRMVRRRRFALRLARLRRTVRRSVVNLRWAVGPRHESDLVARSAREPRGKTRPRSGLGLRRGSSTIRRRLVRNIEWKLEHETRPLPKLRPYTQYAVHVPNDTGHHRQPQSQLTLW